MFEREWEDIMYEQWYSCENDRFECLWEDNSGMHLWISQKEWRSTKSKGYYDDIRWTLWYSMEDADDMYVFFENGEEGTTYDC